MSDGSDKVGPLRAAAVVVAGGTGERFGRPEGKQLAVVAGHPVLWWSVRACAHAAGVTAVVLVCPPDRFGEYAAAAEGAVPEGVELTTAASGATRQASVASGLAQVPDDIDCIIVHDGARPLATPELVEEAMAELAGRDDVEGIVVGHPSVDTLKVVEGDIIVQTPQRSRFWQVQTPQIFYREVLRDAYDEAERAGISGTDDASLVEQSGAAVAVFAGPRDNIKVTLAEDLAFVEAMLISANEG